MGRITDFFGVEPTEVNQSEELYSPSKAALKLAVKNKTDYDHTEYKNAYQGEKLKILIIGTEEDQLSMQNGKKFLTGNHPVELFVPMLHWQNAGFEFDFATPTGQPLKLERWALPDQDGAVMKIYQDSLPSLEKPLSLATMVNSITNKSDYVAIFIPGGHGAILGLPKDKNVKKILEWAFKENKFIVSICHGPAAFLAAGMHEKTEDFLFKGYSIVAFPDAMDRLLPRMGYLPGQMPWFFGEKLQELGVDIVNHIANGNVHQDRKVITGDSPNAANKLGKLSAEQILMEVNSK